MKKAVLTNRIYLDADEKLGEKLKKELTYTIPSPRKRPIPPTILRLWKRVTPKIYSIPSGRIDLIPEDYEFIDKSTSIPVDFPELRITLFPSQQEIYDQVNSSCVLVAPPSWGKTFTAIAIAQKLKQKTLIVCHTTVLRDQWVKDCETVLGFKPSVVGGGKVDYSTPITVANIQTLYNHFDNLKDKFGCVIQDECHHSPARTFFDIMDRSTAKYKIGLSGTPRRKDGKHVILPDLFSKTRFIAAAANRMTPEVVIVKTDIPFFESEGVTISYPEKVSILARNPNYQNMLADLARTMVKLGHIVLLVADRVELLEACHRLLGEDISELVTGGTDMRLREPIHKRILSREKKVLCGTVNIYSEGVSINSISCLILGVQINNDPMLEQLIARIQRLHDHEKLSPVVIDPQLKGKELKPQIMTRLGHYAEKGYKIRVIEK